MTASELMAALSRLDPDMPVVVPGSQSYEEYRVPIAAVQIVEVDQVDDVLDPVPVYACITLGRPKNKVTVISLEGEPLP